MERHYSRRHYRDNRRPRLFVGPGEKIVLLTVSCDALFVWRHYKDRADRMVVECTVFRNEGRWLSSRLIEWAEEFARDRWPGEALTTWVNPTKIRSTNPGFCFLQAGWQRAGWSKRGGLIRLTKLGASEAQL